MRRRDPRLRAPSGRGQAVGRCVLARGLLDGVGGGVVDRDGLDLLGLRDGEPDFGHVVHVDEGQDARRAGGDDVGHGLLDLGLLPDVADLAHDRARPTQPDGAGEDAGREHDARDHTRDDAPLEAAPGVMVGQLLDGDLAGRVGIDHQHPIDLVLAGDLALLEIGVHAPRPPRCPRTVRPAGRDCPGPRPRPRPGRPCHRTTSAAMTTVSSAAARACSSRLSCHDS